MHLWIDNTGLQSAFESVVGAARSEEDVQGLLQFCTYLVFADRLSVNGFEPDSVAARTRDARDRLMELGAPYESLCITPLNEVAYGQACMQAAREAAKDLVDAFKIVPEDLHTLDPPDLPRSVESAQTSYLKAALVAPQTGRLDDLARSAIEEKAAGAVSFMLAVNAELRQAVSALVRRDRGWSQRHTWQLNALMRAYLNQELAGNNAARYAPAIGRALVMQQQNEEVLDALSYSAPAELSKEFDAIAEQLRGIPLKIPAVSSALLYRSKGEPEALIQEALKLREEAVPVRQWLEKKVTGADLDTPEGKSQVRIAVEELRELVEKHLRMKRSEQPTPEGALKLVVTVLAGGLTALGRSRAVDWIAEAVRGRKAVVLSNITKLAGHPVYESRHYRTLLRMGTGRKRHGD